ncbi:MAG: PD-(D/E)XK nuclease family protein [Bacteroidales bacterium]|nr:PD-(D/E)XK nuclease family protein [Bacteroidales bacterium]
MQTFLGHIAKHLLGQYGDRLGKQCMVFPNRRAGLYFMKYLSDLTSRPVWSPGILTITELFEMLTPLQIAEPETLIFELYKSYRKLLLEAENFDTFYFWGEMLINDFDDVDKYLVDAPKLFTNISDLKKIDSDFGGLSEDQIKVIREFWTNFNAGRETDEKREFLKIWSVLPSLYEEFKNNIREKGIAWEGMIYRDVAEKCISGALPELKWENYHFTGFNALNKCEKILMKHLQQNGKAQFYWDYDESYIERNSKHSAGFFIRENIWEFGNNMPSDWNYKTLISESENRANRKIISTTSDIAQVKLIPQLLESFNDVTGEKAHHTAIVLADENLLVPLLTSLPEFISEVNITMGYPLKFSTVYSFIKMLVSLQNNSRKEGGKILLNYSDVSMILLHSFLSNDKNNLSSDILEQINKERKQWIDASKICRNSLLTDIFRKVDSHSELPDYFKNILKNFYTVSEAEEGAEQYFSLNNEFIFRVLQVLNNLERIISSSEIEMTLPTWFRLFDRVLRSITVPFSGEPLAGIQIMGLLETRALDFKNIIILSVNEGVLPRNAAGSSYIPYNLREAYGLPTIRHQDSIYSYYFYRLLHRAENVFFIYNSNSEGLKTGEMSRLLMQLEYLYQKPPEILSLEYRIEAKEALSEVISRNERHQKILEERYFGTFGEPISPSALNTWLSCRMKFYYMYVCGLKEPEKIITGFDPALFGTLLHQIMQEIYMQDKEKQLTREMIMAKAANKENIESVVKKTIAGNFHTSSDDELSGTEQVAVAILVSYAIMILRMDADCAPFTIKALEEENSMLFKLNINNNKTIIKLGGKIDRIDRFGGFWRILDYKTGNVQANIKSIASLFDEEYEKRSEAWFQILMYCEIIADKFKQEFITPVIYSLRNIQAKEFSGKLTIGDSKDQIKTVDNYSEIRSDFRPLLGDVVTQLFNRSSDFIMTKHRQKCRNCPFNQLCRK